jgi:prepilin peptidase CpaA
VSWDRGKLFPMGVALAGALVVYLALGAMGSGA